MAFEERIAGRLVRRQGGYHLEYGYPVAFVGYPQDGAVPIFLGN